VNLLAEAPGWLLVVLIAAVIVAAIEDVVRRRISNVTVLAVIVAAVVAGLIGGVELSLWQNLAVFGAILAAGTAMFSAGMLGGGDVKLFAAVGLWVDLERAVVLVAAVFIAGGFLALVILCWRLLTRRAEGVTMKVRSMRIPYGVAIALGALFTIVVQHEAASAKQSDPLEFHSI
jgi:prepilin peptidase CpaA